MKGKILITVLLFLCPFTNIYSIWKPVKTLEGGTGINVYKDNNILYMTVLNFGVVKSINNGNSWNRILKTTAQSMSVEGNLMVADTMVSSDSGATWQALNMPFNNSIFRGLEVFGGKIFCSDDDSIAYSYNFGVTWTKQLLSTFGANKFIKSSTNKLFAIDEYFLYTTNDSGITWNSICSNPSSTAYFAGVIAEKGDTLFYHNSPAVYVSTNYGSNWTILSNLINKVRSILYENDTLYLTAHLIPSNPDHVAYSTDLGSTVNVIAQQSLFFLDKFVKTDNSLIMPSAGCGALKIDLNNGQLTELDSGIYAVAVYDLIAKHDTIYVLGDNHVYYSYDNANTWLRSPVYSLPWTALDMTVLEKSVYILTANIHKYELDSPAWQYIGSTTGYNISEISSDTSGIYASGSSSILKFPLQGVGYSIYSSSPSIFHAAINDGNIYGVNSTDVLVSPLLLTPQWTAINTGLPVAIHQGIFAFKNSNIYLGGGIGVYRSQPPAYNWIYTGLFNKGLHKLVPYGDAVFAATHKKGICVLRNDTSIWEPINFGLPQWNQDSIHIYAFYSLACSDSQVYTGGAVYPECGLWARPISELNIPIATAVEEIEQASSSFYIYPNPVNTEFQISNYQFQKGDEIRITDVSGRTLFTKTISEKCSMFSVQSSVLASGMYFVTVSGEKGMEVITKKIVVNH